MTNEWANRYGRLDRPALSPKACRCRKPRRVVFGWTNGRTDYQDGREPTKRRAGKTKKTLAGVRSDGRMNERTIRTEGSKRNDVLEKQKRQIPKQIYFSAFSKLQNSNPRPESPFRWTNGRSDGSDRRSIERRDGQTFRALSPQAFGSVERTERTNGRTGGRMNAT